MYTCGETETGDANAAGSEDAWPVKGKNRTETDRAANSQPTELPTAAPTDAPTSIAAPEAPIYTHPLTLSTPARCIVGMMMSPTHNYHEHIGGFWSPFDCASHCELLLRTSAHVM